MNISEFPNNSINCIESCIPNNSMNLPEIESDEIIIFNNPLKNISLNSNFHFEDVLKNEIIKNKNEVCDKKKNLQDETDDYYSTNITTTMKNQPNFDSNNLLSENLVIDNDIDKLFKLSDEYKNKIFFEHNKSPQNPTFLGKKRCNINNDIFEDLISIDSNDIDYFNESPKIIYNEDQNIFSKNFQRIQDNSKIENSSYFEFGIIKANHGSELRIEELNTSKFQETKQIFRIYKQKRSLESTTNVPNKNSEYFFNIFKIETPNNDELRVQNIKCQRKFDNDSIYKKIKTDCFKCLRNKIALYDFFNQSFISDMNITENYKINQTTIGKMINDILEEKFTKCDVYLNNPNNLKELNRIIDTEQNILDLTFGEFYEKVYLNSDDLKIKLAEIKQKEEEKYYKEFEKRVYNYLIYFQEKINKSNKK